MTPGGRTGDGFEIARLRGEFSQFSRDCERRLMTLERKTEQQDRDIRRLQARLAMIIGAAAAAGGLAGNLLARFLQH